MNDAAVLTVVGFGMQYLRGLRQFNDGLTLLTALAIGLLLSWLEPHTYTPKELIVRGFGYVPTVLGGVFMGHLAAQYTTIVPRWNSYSKPNGNGR
jgi:hypothetical protein